MTKTTGILTAVFALGVIFSIPAFAAPKGCNCSGGSGGYAAGYGPGSMGHVPSKNGGGNGGGVSNPNNQGGYQREDNFMCVVGPRVQYVVSQRACRKLVHAYLSGYGNGQGHGNYVSNEGHSVSHATRMQQKKRYAKAHRGKARHGRVTHARGRGGNTYNINNYGTIIINKGGAW